VTCQVCARAEVSTPFAPLLRSTRLLAAVQDAHKLYMAMEVCTGGDLYEQLRVRAPLPVVDVRFYAAEMVAMLAYLRQQRVVFRCGAPAATPAEPQWLRRNASRMCICISCCT
jgi:hypothetical protein